MVKDWLVKYYGPCEDMERDLNQYAGQMGDWTVFQIVNHGHLLLVIFRRRILG